MSVHINLCGMEFVVHGPAAIPGTCCRGILPRAGSRRRRHRSRISPHRLGIPLPTRDHCSRYGSCLTVHSAVSEVLRESPAVAVGSGLLLALVSAFVWNERVRKRRPKEQQMTDQGSDDVAEMQKKLDDLQAELQAERRRIAVLEKARAAAVMDVTQALGQKRDAEFALDEAQDRIKKLEEEQNTDRQLGEEELETLVAAAMEALPEGVKGQIGDEGIEVLRQWVAENIVSEKAQMHGSDVDAYVQKLESDSRALKGKVKEAQVEVATIKDYVKTELHDMTVVLIKSRDEAKELSEQNAQLENALSIMKPRLAEAENVIKNLQQLLAKSGNQSEKVSSSITEANMRYGHQMRAEAAYMVEKVEDSASAEVHKIMQKAQSAQQKALKEYLEAARAREREQKLRSSLAEAQEQIKEKALEVKYLTELLQILSSKEAQENAEEQSLKQNDSLWNED